MTAAFFLAKILNSIVSTLDKSDVFATENRKKLEADLREDSDLMFWKSLVVTTEDGRVTSTFTASKNAITSIFGKQDSRFKKQRCLGIHLGGSSKMKLILEQELKNDVAQLSHIGDPVATDISTTSITIPRGFERMPLTENGQFNLPSAPSDLILPLDVQLILNIFVQEGLTENAANMFLE
jgi:hypothetical protein